MASKLPDYVASAQAVPPDARTAWYKNTAQTYAGIMLWFVFWQKIVSGSDTFGGSLSQGLYIALLGLLVAALFCHFLTYLVPGLLGMKTGLPLYVVGTSTYGVRGGRFMPGFLMGALQFGWLAVNAYFSCHLICTSLGRELPDISRFDPVHSLMTVAFILLAVSVGIKGIKYVAVVATFVPLVFLGILLVLLGITARGLTDFEAGDLVATNKAAAQKAVADLEQKANEAEEKAPGSEEAKEAAKAAKDKRSWAQADARNDLPVPFVFLFVSAYVVGFFATAGAAGTDFGMNNRHAADVQWGGLVGIVGATFFAGGAAMLIVAGAYGGNMVPPESQGVLNPVSLIPDLVGEFWAKVMYILLALASFAPACFPAFIATNSFKTTMPKISPWISVGLGTLVAMLLGISGVAGQAEDVFTVVGASFGPICGAMMADYLLAGRKWAGPRAGFNLAGWISWVVGFAVGGYDLIAKFLSEHPEEYMNVIWCPPMAALIVGFVLYVILAKIGLDGEKLDMPGAREEPAA